MKTIRFDEKFGLQPLWDKANETALFRPMEKKDDFGFTKSLECMKWPLTIDEEQVPFPQTQE